MAIMTARMVTFNSIECCQMTTDPSERYVHGAGVDEILTKGTSAGSVYYQQDGLNSVTGLTNDSGQVIESYAYDVYGSVTILNSPFIPQPSSLVSNRFLYTGREWVAEAGLYDYRNRVYSMELGRFLQTDPILFEGGPNLYAYVGNGPIGSWDPLGLFEPKLGQPSGRGVDLNFHSQGVQRNPTSNPRMAFDDDESITVMAHGLSRYSNGALMKVPFILDQRGYPNGDPGTPDDHPDEKVPILTAEQLAKIIMADPNWKSATNVVLYSCNTGDGGDKSFAKRLARILKKRVYAPTNVLRIRGGVPVSIDYNGVYLPFNP